MGGKTKKRRRKRDTPKQPKNGFLFYLNDHRATKKADLDGNNIKGRGKLQAALVNIGR